MKLAIPTGIGSSHLNISYRQRSRHDRQHEDVRARVLLPMRTQATDSSRLRILPSSPSTAMEAGRNSAANGDGEGFSYAHGPVREINGGINQPKITSCPSGRCSLTGFTM
jgi:hypothetical protein